MSVFSLYLVMMLCCWMIPLMLVMFHGLGLYESALADAYRFSGGPLPSRGLSFR